MDTKMNLTNEMNKNVGVAHTMETNKMERYNVASICKKIDGFEVLFNHAAQRESDQWTAKMKGNLISDIIQGNPVPSLVFAEEVHENGTTTKWDLDGKQRCFTIYDYRNDGFKIAKGIRRNIIQYQSITIEDGKRLTELKTFDIVGKTFSQLPAELQDRINDYCFDVVLYLNCSAEDILYHIARYNDGRPMNKTQKGIIQLGGEYATEVKEIAKHNFFTDFGDYGKNAKEKGTIDRAICETVMASNYLDDWKTNQEDICSYIRENGSFDDFYAVEDTLDRLEEIVDGRTECLFNGKESFIWFTVFNRFKKYNADDEKFADFMELFIEELHSKVIGEKSYDDLEGRRSTKDKTLVVNKINHLDALLKEFLGISEDTAA